MGIVAKELGKFFLHNMSGNIELSIGREVHIHYGGIRISLTDTEFLLFSDLLTAARQQFDIIKRDDHKG